MIDIHFRLYLETCSVLGDLTNGNVTLEQASYTTAAMFSCDVGFSLLGANNVTCQTDGTWSDTMPSCGKLTKQIIMRNI
jgi:hypothetical protein